MATGTKTVEINIENPNICNNKSNCNKRQKGKGILWVVLGTVAFGLLNKIKKKDSYDK